MRGWSRRHNDRPLTGRPALFLDRDGTIIENVPYLADPAGVVPIAGAVQMMRAFQVAGYAIILATNQSGVARGLCSERQYRAVEARVVSVFGADLIDATYACPFHPEGDGPFSRPHPWRKPGPGMLIDAAADWSLDLPRSIMIGDSASDVAAGLAAGVATVGHVASGHGAAERTEVAALIGALPPSSVATFWLAPTVAGFRPARSAS